MERPMPLYADSSAYIGTRTALQAYVMMDPNRSRRLRNQTNIGDILLVGEQLRVRMHTDNPHLIKDRRHHFRSHSCCFIGRETVDWLVESKQAPDRETAILLMKILLDNDIIHQIGSTVMWVNPCSCLVSVTLYDKAGVHGEWIFRLPVPPGGASYVLPVVPTVLRGKVYLVGTWIILQLYQVPEEQPFRDDAGFYRYRKDDSTFPWHESVTLFLKGQRLFNRLFADSETVMRVQEEEGQLYQHAFQGTQLLDWLTASGDFDTRAEAVAECRRMLENDVIRHVTDSHHFKDEPLLYQFKTDYSRKPQLLDLLGEVPPVWCTSPHRSLPRGCGDRAGINGRKHSPATRSPQHLIKGLDIPHDRRPQRTESGYHSYPEDETGSGSPQFGSPNSSTSQQSPGGVTGMLFRKATAEELEAAGSPYLKKHIRISSDPVGFGFVVRGEGPSYVKTVDPTGPAAQAGLKVGQYVVKVNDKHVIGMNHRSLAHVILAHMGYLRLVVMEHVCDK